MSFILRIIFLLLFCFQTLKAEPYQINAGDILEVSVWREETLQKELRVLPDGTISFPLSGVIKVAGKSVDAVREELTKKLSKYITDPVVSVAVKAAEGNVVYVLGQVKTPGHFVMNQQMDVMQILSLAGGLTPFAKANDIVILRRNSTGTEAIKFKYGELEDGEGLNNNHLLKSTDVIVVP
jgi:polysaccharide export outer membrane protein